MSKKTFSIVSLNISDKIGTVKKPVDKITLIEDKGVLNDGHFGRAKDRQVSMLAIEDIEYSSKKMNVELKAGDFAENITTKGIELFSLPLGTNIYIGNAILKVSKIGKECHKSCDIKKLVGECIMPERGIFVSVIKGGDITIEDTCYYSVG